MSGPKTYSIVSFDSELQIIFFKQNQITNLVNQIEKITINDSNLQIDFNGRKELSDLSVKIKEALRNFSIKPNIYFMSAAETEARQKISNKNIKLDQLLSRLKNILKNLEKKVDDYKSYKNYLTLNEQNQNSFNQFKKTTLEYYNKILKEKYPNELSLATNNIKKIKYQLVPEKFHWGFSEELNKKKEHLTKYLIEKEQKINEIKLNISNKIIELSGDINIYDEENPEINKWTDKINDIIAKCEIDIYKKQFLQKLKELKESDILKNIYYYKELFNEINSFVSNHKNKIELISIMNKINDSNLHKELSTKIALIIENIKNTLKKSRIGEAEVKIYKEHLQKLLIEDKKLKEREQIKLKEKIFIKKQLINILTEMNYEPVFDMQVINFEKENSFLLKIPQQENYINIMITNDGRINYNFQIPQNPRDLSTDEKDKKLKEMNISCDLFQESLEYLKKVGLSIQIKHSTPANADALMSFTKKTKNLLKDKIQKKQRMKSKEKQTKRKYLK